ncbi:thiamine phosphate synthase [Vandammella animalimorsus]|uniref:Thiamine-phosphate synthase n=1 Tax=Vandammella animalimorsus TaxID=2029117 RepID=A0A2A2AE77_9BURK|nr:thiamine phosphate synthase [Vandammella animalimorsus]PAT36031.1 thiamine phosphate synthase [Vandammella animalimorsus]
MSLDLALYLVTDSGQCARAGRNLQETVLRAVEGGVRIVQIREKDASAREFLASVCAVAQVLPTQVPLLVNDRIDVFLAARAAGARVAGVHIGQSEIPAKLARQLIGPQAILGLSAATPAALAEAERCGVVDYVGIGPLNTTTTKKNAPPALGLPALQALSQGVRLPAVAIGGIGSGDMAGLRAAGFDGAAVVSAICAAPDPRQAAQALLQAWQHGA